MHSPTAGSWEFFPPYERGTPVCTLHTSASAVLELTTLRIPWRSVDREHNAPSEIAQVSFHHYLNPQGSEDPQYLNPKGSYDPDYLNSKGS